MKTTTVSSIVKIEEEILRNFQPVNETLATDVVLAKKQPACKAFWRG